MTLQGLARCAALVAVISAPLASADAPKVAKLNDAELHVLAHYHAVNQIEIMLGKLAQQRGTRAAVKDYGAMLVKDHTANDRTLATFAKQHGATVPAKETQLSAAEVDAGKQMQDDIDDMKTAKGVEFERRFLAFSVTAHEAELSRLDGSISDVSVPELATILETMKPAFQHHADRARELEQGTPQARN